MFRKQAEQDTRKEFMAADIGMIDGIGQKGDIGNSAPPQRAPFGRRIGHRDTARFAELPETANIRTRILVEFHRFDLHPIGPDKMRRDENHFGAILLQPFDNARVVRGDTGLVEIGVVDELDGDEVGLGF